MLSPIIILDEGHKAYSEMRQDTCAGLNPSVIVELSATPTDDTQCAWWTSRLGIEARGDTS